jgi:hypothetical protein
MAHFAKMDENNVVLTVIVVNNDVIDNLPFPESEPIGIEFCRSIYGQDSNWLQTSYNGSFRYRYAGIGDLYLAWCDQFAPPQPYPDWIYNPETHEWEPPVPVV